MEQYLIVEKTDSVLVKKLESDIDRLKIIKQLKNTIDSDKITNIFFIDTTNNIVYQYSFGEPDKNDIYNCAMKSDELYLLIEDKKNQLFSQIKKYINNRYNIEEDMDFDGEYLNYLVIPNIKTNEREIFVNIKNKFNFESVDVEEEDDNVYRVSVYNPLSVLFKIINLN